MSSKRRIIYQIDLNQLSERDFIATIRDTFGIEPERVNDPQPYPGKTIFISYRRDDSADITGRIYDWLNRYFGARSLFRDYDSIIPGTDFRQHLEREVLACDVMLVIMGDAWDSDAMLERLHDDSDYVRYEIAVALARDIPVLPVWVQTRDTMPRPAKLPDDLKALVYREASYVRSDRYFSVHIQQLIDEIDTLFNLS